MTEPHPGQVLLLDLVESVSFQDPLGKGKKIKSKFSTTLCNGNRLSSEWDTGIVTTKRLRIMTKVLMEASRCYSGSCFDRCNKKEKVQGLIAD